ncbi:MAG: energy transducer TonB [Bacteroidetes bacterium]|nr:energy transducer TonB [Bacteroidota bacterium]MDA1224122.1 energy transducer TonB [Bacteroidota bacterium]
MTQQIAPPHSHKYSALLNPNIIGLARIIGRKAAQPLCICLLTIIASIGYAKSTGYSKSTVEIETSVLLSNHNTIITKPPVLSKQHVNWWRHHGSPEPIMGWKALDSLVKSNIPELNQVMDKQGKLVFLLNLKIGKKGKVDYVEIFDSNLPDTTIHSKLASALITIPFTPYRSNKGKIISANCLVLMELSALLPSQESMQNDTLIPNKEIKSARFLGGEDLFLRYVSDEFVYPGRCLDANINGYVLIRFMVDRNGFVSRCQIMGGSSACPEFGKEAIRIFYLCPKWIPATHEGKNINAYFQVPINMRVN